MRSTLTRPSRPKAASQYVGALEVLGIQLEGELELLQAALLRYRVLERRVKAFRWKRALRSASEVLTEAIELEPSVVPALERLTRRLARPTELNEPGAQLLKALTTARQALLESLHRRMGQAESLAHALQEASAVVLKPLPTTPREGELRIFESAFSGQRW